MAKELSKEQQEDYLMSKSVMDAPRSIPQQIVDFFFGRGLEEQATNAFSNLPMLRVMTLPELEAIARLANKTGLGSKWFRGHSSEHRTVEDVVKEGFKERASLQHWGEPLGVSLTSDPKVAEHFAKGNPVLRVAVTAPEERVLDVGGFTTGMDPYKAMEILRESERQVLQEYNSPTLKMTPIDFMKHLMGQGYDPAEALSKSLHKMPVNPEMGEFNKRLSEAIRQRGFDVLAYHPGRYSERELRVLDVNKAVPLGYSGIKTEITPFKRAIKVPGIGPETKRFLEFVNTFSPNFDYSNADALGSYIAEYKKINKLGPVSTVVLKDELEKIQYSIRHKDTKVLRRFQEKYSDILEAPIDYDEVPEHRLHDIYRKEPATWYMGKEPPTYKPDSYMMGDAVHKAQNDLLDVPFEEEPELAKAIDSVMGKGASKKADPDTTEQIVNLLGIEKKSQEISKDNLDLIAKESAYNPAFFGKTFDEVAKSLGFGAISQKDFGYVLHKFSLINDEIAP